MSAIILKIIASLTMTIDHMASILLNNNQTMRFIGRIAFPIYGFLLVEGFNHVKNDNKRLIKYVLRILIVGIFSEVIYDLYFFNTYVYVLNQNIMFTLFTALICMIIYEKMSNSLIDKLVALVLIIYVALISEILFLDYGFLGIMLIFNYYIISKLNNKKIYYILNTMLYLSLFILFNSFTYTTLGVLLSLIPICFYNGTKGYNSKTIKYMFYLYYPAHIIILLLIKTVL